MWATGGVEPAVIVWWTVSLWPSGSVTLRPTLIDPLALYVFDGVFEVESSYAPSPSRSQA